MEKVCAVAPFDNWENFLFVIAFENELSIAFTVLMTSATKC